MTKEEQQEPETAGALLTAEQILAADDISTKRIAVPEWGGDLIITNLPGFKRDKFEEMIQGRMKGIGDNKRLTNYRLLKVTLISMCLVHPDGKQLFNTKQLEALDKKNSGVLTRVFNACKDFNGMTEEEVRKLVGNSETDPSGDDGSSLPPGSDAQ